MRVYVRPFGSGPPAVYTTTRPDVFKEEINMMGQSWCAKRNMWIAGAAAVLLLAAVAPPPADRMVLGEEFTATW